MPVDSQTVPRDNLAEQFQLQKISTIAQIAGQLVYASMRMQPAGILNDFRKDELDELYLDGERIDFTLKPERAAQIAEAVFNAAEARVLGAAPASPQRSTPELLRIIRLLEKLRTNTLDANERAELAERIEGGL